MEELINLQLMIFSLIAIGLLVKKIGMVGKTGQKNLTDLVVNLILPCNIVESFMVKFSADIAADFADIFIISLLIQAGCVLLGHLLFKKTTEGRRKCLRYGTICSNAGFMGNPLAEGVFGETGLLYASIFLIPQRIVMWTAGVSSFQKTESGKTAYRKILTHPCMVATYIGMVIMVFQIPLPGVLQDTILSFSNCCTAMTMVYIGTILTDVNFRELFGGHQIFFAAVRLVLIPLLVFGICRLARVDALITGVSTLLSATPAGSTTSLLAAKYGADEKAAARCVVFTTALSAVTIPVWSMFLLRP